MLEFCRVQLRLSKWGGGEGQRQFAKLGQTNQSLPQKFGWMEFAKFHFS